MRRAVVAIVAITLAAASCGHAQHLRAAQSAIDLNDTLTADDETMAANRDGRELAQGEFP